ncbi:hypothetical protein HIM_10337 [Hirsutella minnesotensis 3608]|uniref:DUF7730 domain-containing protein n=1 Tax=Hirsutella minnesotensis 3608 TaxID=1043627 RepID=A0A0F7ZG46_9HYPO|nr:hypothetical protein HIM_10337 [Hirsutella minnesotensis 3608]
MSIPSLLVIRDPSPASRAAAFLPRPSNPLPVMPKRLMRWLRKDKDECPPPPALPKSRPRKLTATRHAIAAATGDSPLFRRLPTEVRRQILQQAFGARTVHMDLVLERPVYKRLAGTTWPRCEVNVARHANVAPCEARDRSKPRQWRWSGSVCHRLCFSWHLAPAAEFAYRQPLRDSCWEGWAGCDLWPGETPQKCFVGAMGWLLACRQAYCEGVDVIYATNRFHLRGTHLFAHLPRLIIRPRLDTIASVELVWNLDTRQLNHGGGMRTDEAYHGPDGFKKLVAMIPATTPNLQCLYLTIIKCPVLAPDQHFVQESSSWLSRRHSVTETMLREVDKIVWKLKSLAGCRISLPESMYAPWVDISTGTEIPLSGLGRPMLDIHATRRDLAQLYGIEATLLLQLRDYWVLRGVLDAPRTFVSETM